MTLINSTGRAVSPASTHDSPASTHDSPASTKGSPASTQGSPASTQGSPASTDALRSCAEASYTVAHEALCDAEPWLGYRAIAQLCGHLAVMRRLVCPAASRRLGPDHCLAAACRAEAVRAEWALRLFECWLAGDAHAVRVPDETVQALFEQHLNSYRTAERVLLARLADLIPDAEHARLAQRYRALLTAAPTRPHPRSPRAGQLGKLAFRFQGFFDRALDTIDSRPGRRPARPRGA